MQVAPEPSTVEMLRDLVISPTPALSRDTIQKIHNIVWEHAYLPPLPFSWDIIQNRKYCAVACISPTPAPSRDIRRLVPAEAIQTLLPHAYLFFAL